MQAKSVQKQAYTDREKDETGKRREATKEANDVALVKQENVACVLITCSGYFWLNIFEKIKKKQFEAKRQRRRQEAAKKGRSGNSNSSN